MFANDGAKRLYEELGFGIGEGRFLIKGSAYVFHTRWVDEHLPGGKEAQFAALGPVGESEFFNQIFMAGAMYDVFPLVALGHACAALRGEPLEEFVAMRARYQSEQDLKYIRRWLVKLASPAAVAKRLPGVLTSYFDFGEAETEISEGAMSAHIRAVPRVIGSWLIASYEGFGQHALEVNGATNVTLSGEALHRSETDRGLPMSDLRIELRWQ